MTNNCYMCKSVVFDGFVTCAGHCNRVAHYTCAAISKEAYLSICKYDNVKWFCSDCDCVALSTIDKKLSLLVETVAAIKVSTSEPRYPINYAVIPSTDVADSLKCF